jgi:hypothetical protein
MACHPAARQHIHASASTLPPTPMSTSTSMRSPDPIELPDGKRIFPPRLHGGPIDELSSVPLDSQQPCRSRVSGADRPAGTGKDLGPSRPGDGPGARPKDPPPAVVGSRPKQRGGPACTVGGD